MSETSIQDPLELMLKKTGCIEYHYKVQECIAETGDWRICQKQVKEFKECMQHYTKTNWSQYCTFPDAKLALVVRGDLKMSKGKTAVQCAHAAVLCVQDAQCSSMEEQREILQSWLKQGQPKIVLRVENGCDDLLHLQNAAKKQGIVTVMVHDAGRTQLAAGTATVLGIGPDFVNKIDTIVSNLKLL